jgi:hypothetical protein
MKLKLKALSLSLLAIAAVNSAQAVEVKGTVISNAVITDPAARAKLGNTQKVVLIRVKLNKEEKNTLNGIRRLAAKHKTLSDDTLPRNAEVPMGNEKHPVPVLDQGMHGTCVTFATTAAFDALIDKGDYISQVCSLELGYYLKQNAYTYSGWNGTFGPLAINQLLLNGIVPKAKQKEVGCAGVHSYPYFGGESVAMNPDEYHGLSEQVNNHFYMEPMYGMFELSLNANTHEYDVDKLVLDIKKELAIKQAGRDSRITFGIILPVRMCSSGACGTYHASNDTWALTKSMEREFDNDELGGHEMVITAYDDDAEVTDSEGGTHKGVFRLRNSWGKSVGDRGNYYVTYDFFKRFVMEAQRLVRTDEVVLELDDQS